MSHYGQEPVSSASFLKFNVTLKLLCQLFPTQMLVLTIHIDIVGPLPSSGGYSYLLTCVDRFTRWPEAIPLTCITADSVAKAFMGGGGFPDLVLRQSSQQTADANLNQLCGHN